VVAGPIGLVLLQATSFCNIDCAYCYLPGRAVRGKTMDLATVAAVAQLIFDSSLLEGSLDIVWHAGEPLTLQPDYYAQAIAILEAGRPRNVRLNYGFQTNGTLIDDPWIDFFETYRINVGISLDGPRSLHDRYRRQRNGSGSYARVMNGIAKLQARDYPFHIIGVVTAQTLRQAAELMAFYRSLRPTAVGLNVEEVEAQNSHSSLYEYGSVEAFERFVADVLRDAAASGGSQMMIRDFQRTMSSLIAGSPQDNDQVVPLRIVTIAWNGDISTFSPELLALSGPQVERFVFGNAHRCAALVDIMADERFKSAYTEIQRGVSNCAAECEYFQYCGGGAPVNKLSETGRLDTTETMFCRLTKKTWVDACLGLAAAPESRFELCPAV
jgi:uncharacterized protein